MKKLTKAEEEIMQVLWEIKRGVVHDIIDNLSDSKPAYTTVSSIIRILEKKGFVGHKAYGKTHEYFPLIARQEYTNEYFRSFIDRYFSNSYKKFASFFTKQENLCIIEDEIKNQEKNK